jgi:hypothetical protein
MYSPQNREFGIWGAGGLNPPPPPRYANGDMYVFKDLVYTQMFTNFVSVIKPNEIML